jgi:hypothetical protein
MIIGKNRETEKQAQCLQFICDISQKNVILARWCKTKEKNLNQTDTTKTPCVEQNPNCKHLSHTNRLENAEKIKKSYQRIFHSVS